MATCNECLYQPICNTYASFGVTDLPASDISPCELFKNKADVVEVVRCRDCEYYKATGRLGEFDEPIGVCKKEVNFYDDEPKEVLSVDFCSDGKKVQK